MADGKQLRPAPVVSGNYHNNKKLMQLDYRNLGLQLPPMSPTPGGIPTMQDRMLPQARQAPMSITPGRTMGNDGSPMRPDPVGNWNPFPANGMQSHPDPTGGWNPFPYGQPQAQVQNEPGGSPWGPPQSVTQNEPGGNPWGQPQGVTSPPQGGIGFGGGPGMPQGGGLNYGPNLMQMIMQMRSRSM